MFKQRLAAALALCLLLIGPTLAAEPKLKPGDLAPDVVGKTLDGEVVKLSAYSGKVIVLSFWATWCPYCIKELPILNNIQTKIGKDQLAVIAVNVEERKVFKAAQRALGGVLNVNFAYDPEETGRNNYGVDSYPHMAIIGADGRILRVYRGYGEGMLDTIVSDLNKALKAQAELREKQGAAVSAGSTAPAATETRP
ncbi:MAG TPA: TlpA disulfide reductase family protein [Burkholderiaceae bacterium]